MASFVKDLFVLLKEETRILIGRHEISAGLFRLKQPGITTTQTTEIVIEGAPSSGNSFALVAFEAAQKKKVRIAHHQHLPFQVTRAARYHIPCIVIIRPPLDAVVSRVARYGFYQPQTRQAELWAGYALRHWNMFHEQILDCRPKFLVCEFRELISDYPAVIERTNSKFNARFDVPTAELCAQSLSALAEGLRPDKERDVRKNKFKEWMRQEQIFAQRLERAQKLYEVVRASA
ncbi:MAG: hypothetical protein HFACDABA_01587 [Anaerolineales bacterium]|nr:hypothetical protein [Anaerolineales bacterium]